MCLTIETGQKAKIAQEDIYTFKFLYVKKDKHTSKDKLVSPYKKYIWELNKEQKVLKLYKRRISKFSGDDGEIINQGYYSYDVNKMPPSFLQNGEFFLCKIPKGATYYIGMDAQVCSTQLIILECIYSHRGDHDFAKHHKINITRMSYDQRLQYLIRMLNSYNLNTRL